MWSHVFFGIQYTFIKWTEWTLAMALPWWQHQKHWHGIIIIIIIIIIIRCIIALVRLFHASPSLPRSDKINIGIGRWLLSPACSWYINGGGAPIHGGEHIRRLFSVLSLVSCSALKSDNNIDYDDGWPGRRRLISRGLDVTTRAGLVRNVTTHSTDWTGRRPGWERRIQLGDSHWWRTVTSDAASQRPTLLRGSPVIRRV